MLRTKDDDAEAFQSLLLNYQPKIYRFLRQLVASDTLAEDLTQDVFLRVWRARKSYLPTAKFATWIFLIAGNVANNALRDQSRRRESQSPRYTDNSSSIMPLEEIAVASTGALAVRKLDKAERAEMVQVAVQALNQRQRTALLLCKFENLSYQEIADVMGLSVKAVKSLLSRARMNLKTLLQPYVEEGRLPQKEESEPSPNCPESSTGNSIEGG